MADYIPPDPPTPVLFDFTSGSYTAPSVEPVLFNFVETGGGYTPAPEKGRMFLVE